MKRVRVGGRERKRSRRRQAGSHQGEKGKEGVSAKKEKPRIQE